METHAVVLLALVASAFAGPIAYRDFSDDTSCARECTGSNKFKYEPGSTYTYDYKVKTTTTMENADASSASVSIQATAKIEVLSKCEMALKLSDVSLEEVGLDGVSRPVPQQGRLRQALTKGTLRFAFQDGVVSNLCPAEGEDRWALNVKRGVLSALQNAMDDVAKAKTVQEEDVTGRCSVEYSPAGSSWYTRSVKKSKDLLGCTDRHGLRSALQATPYRVPSEVQSMPLLKSTHECTQQIDKSLHYVTSTVCLERHVFRPFSRHDNGAATTVEQTLTFKSKTSGVRTRMDAVTDRADMFFEHAYAPGQEEKGRNDAEAKLRELCQVTKEDVRPETPRLFAQLVEILKALDASSLRALYLQLKGSALCEGNLDRTKKFFLDALPMTQTSAGVEMMTKLLIDKEVTGLEADLYVTSLALIQHPSKEMLQESKALLESNDLSRKSMLAVSTLVNAYCQRQADCGSDPAVTGIMAALEKIIGARCYVADKHLDKILLALRAAGNAGHATRITATLTRCLTRKSNPLEVRLAALEAFRRQPCSADRSEVISAFQNVDEDHELRIAAYLTAMVCPTQDVLSRVRQVLENEDVNQVTSFVWSHLSNLMETSAPLKQSLRAIVEDAKLKEEFTLASLKYSRNLEGSFFLEKFNLGAMMESNVIWSQDSYPRSGMVNLTVDLFGSSVNLLEVGGRLEGLDMLLESYLGPYGYFSDKTNKAPKRNLDDVRGSLYMRLFGNELAYGHFKGMKASSSGSSFNMLEFLIDLSKDHDYKFSQSAVFMDTTLTVPTVAGLPLHLCVNGTATVDMVASGKLDLRKVATSPRSLTVDGVLQPSGAVEIASTMSVEAGSTSSGLRMVTTLHSSTALRGRVELQRGKVLKVEWDVPQDKVELLDVKSTFFTLHGSEEKEQDLITDNRKSLKLCTGTKLAKVTGLELCGEVSFPNASMRNEAPYFPFTGPVSASLSLFKRDSHSSYKLIAKRNENSFSSMAQLAFDTPGSSVDRALSFDISLNYKKKQFDLSLLSPWKKAIFVSSVKDERKQKALAGKLILDDKREYSVKAQLTSQSGKTKNDQVWAPQVEIKSPSITPVTLDGSFLIRKKERLEVDLTLAGVATRPMNLKSTVINSKSEKSFDVTFNKGDKGDYSALASLDADLGGGPKRLAARLNVKTPTKELVSFQAKGDLRPGKTFKGDMSLDVDDLMAKPIVLNANLRRTARPRGTKFQGQITLTSKLASGKTYGFVQLRTKGGVQSRVTLDYTVPRVARDKITVSGKLNDKSTKSLIKYIANANVALKRNPEYNFVTGADFSHSKRHTETGAWLVYGKNAKSKINRFDINASVKRKGSVSLKSADLNFRGSLTFPPQGVNVQVKGSHEHNKKSLDSSFNLKYGKDKEASVALMLKDASKKLTKLTGSLKTMCPGAKVALSTVLTQRNRRAYEHLISLDWNKVSHAVKTTYRKVKDAHALESLVRLEGLKPVSVSASSNFDPLRHKGDVALSYSKNKYEVKTSHKLGGDAGKLDLEVAYPKRRLTLAMEGGRNRNKYTGSLNADWDADNKKSNSRVKLDGSARLQSWKDLSANGALSYPERDLTFSLRHEKKGNTYGSHTDFSWSKREQIAVDVTLQKEKNEVSGDVAITTPFRKYGKMAAGAVLSERSDRYTAVATASLGNDKLKSTQTLFKPISLKNLAFDWEVSTPFYGWRKMDASLKHTLDSSLTTVLKGSVGKDKAELTVTANNRGDLLTRRDLEASATFKSTISGWKEATASARHQDDGNRWTCNYQVSRNGKPYSLSLDLSAYRQGWQLQSNGQLLAIAPTDRMDINWRHQNTGNELVSDVTANVGRGRMVRFSMTGTHMLGATRKMTGSISLQTPWKKTEDLALNFEHEHGFGFIRSLSYVKSEGREISSSNVNYRRTPGQADFDFTITSPYNDDISGKINARYQDSPVTGHAELQWARSNKFALDGDFTLQLPLEGTVRMTSPWHPAVFLAASHKKEAGQWVSGARLDYGRRKTIEAKSTLGLDDHKMAALHLTTPFEQVRQMDAGFELVGDLSSFLLKTSLSAQPVLGRYSSDVTWKSAKDKVDGKLRVETPIQGFQYGQVVVAAQGQLLAGNARMEINYSPQQSISLTSSHNFDRDADVEMTLMTPYSGWEYINAKMTNDLVQSALRSHAEVSYDRYNKVEADMNAGWEREITGSMSVRTPFSGYEQSSALFRHSGNLKDFTSHVEARALGHNVEADANFEYGYKSKAGASFKSSFPGWESVVFSGESQGPATNLRSSASLEYGQGRRAQTQLNFRFVPKKRIRVTFGLKTPLTQDLDFTFNQQGDNTEASQKINIQYGPDYAYSQADSMTMKDIVLLKSDRKTTWAGVESTSSFFLRHEGPLSNMNTQVTMAGNGREIKMTSSFQSSPAVRGDLNIETPFDDFRNFGLTFQHSGSLEAFTSQGTVTYMEGKDITGKVKFNHRGIQQINADVEVMTPFMGFRKSKVVLSQNGPWNDFKTHLEAESGPHNLNADANFQHRARKTSGSLILASSCEAFQNLKAMFNKEGTNDDFRSSAELTLNGQELVSGDLAHRRTDYLLVSSLNFRNLYTEPLALALDYDGTPSRFTNKMSASMGQDYSIVSDSRFNLDLPTIEATSSVTYKVAGEGNMASVTFKKEGEWSDVKMTLTGSHGDETGEIVTTFQNTDKVAGAVAISTPVAPYHSLGASFQHAGPSDNFNSEARLRYRDGEEIVLSGNFYNNQWRRLTASAQLTTPFRDLEMTKVQYTHTGDSRGFTCEAKADYSQGKAITGDLRVTYEPKVDFDLKVNTPFAGYEDMSATASYDSQWKRYAAEGKVSVGGEAVSATGRVDYSGSPMTASLVLTTPLQDFRQTQLRASHEGEPTDFKSSVSFQSQLTDDVQGDVAFRYGSLTDMDASASLTSSLQGMENLKVAASASESGPVFSHHLKLDWTPTDWCSLDTTFRKDQQWFETNTVATATLTTPWAAYRSMQVTGRHLTSDNKLQQEFTSSWNGDKLFDADWTYDKNDQHQVSMNMRKPRAMQVTAAGSGGDGLNSEIFLNWDRNHPESNVRVKVNYDNKDSGEQTDRQWALKLIHPVRTVGVEGSLVASPKQLKSTGAIIFHERDGQKVWYELEGSESGNYYRSVQDGSLKLGLPTRTLEGRLSSASQGQIRTLEGALLWDAERSQDKQVGAKLVLTPSDRSSKADLTLRLPSVNKEFQIGSEVTVNQGRTLFDSKTEFSYSPNARKTLVLTSRLEDISRGYGNSNYSLSLGLTHAQTDVNVQLKSHAGMDDEKLTGGLDLQYLTSARQTKTLFLLGEIDRLRRQISLMLDSPLQQLQASASVDSLEPLKVKVGGQQDGVPFEATMLLDPIKKSMRLRSTYDLDNPDDALVFRAFYVNETYLQASLTREVKGERILDGQVDLALTTPHLLTSKAGWRPQVLADFEGFLGNKVRKNGDRLVRSVDEVSEAVKEEMEGKYRDIAQALKAELGDLAQLLDQEMADVSRELQGARREMRRMYNRNAFHLKDMGDSAKQAFHVAFGAMKGAVDVYGSFHKQVTESISKFLDELTSLPVGSMYDDAMQQLTVWLKEQVLESVQSLQTQVAMLEERLVAVRDSYRNLRHSLSNSVSEQVETLKKHPVVQRLRDSIPDYEAYIDAAHRQLQAVSIPERYTGAIYGARDLINAGLSQVIDSQDLQNIHEASNEVYQQAVWAYQYWQVEENLKQHLKNIIAAIEDILLEEVAVYREKLDYFKETRVVSFRPEVGALIVELGLPLPLKDLQSLPDFVAYLEEVKATADRYMPAVDVATEMYNQYFPTSWFMSNKTTPIPEDDLNDQLRDYLSAPDYRRRNRPSIRSA